MPIDRTLSCQCGKVTLDVQGPPIASVQCLCTSCRAAADRLSNLQGAPKVLDAHGATAYVMQRKDRAQVTGGQDQLRDFRLSPDAGTRRCVATCCNTPMFLDLKGGHWLSIYGELWPVGTLPPLYVRTMTGDLDDASGLPDDVPNLKKHSLPFMGRLLGAWVRMGFRVPKFVTNPPLEF